MKMNVKVKKREKDLYLQRLKGLVRARGLKWTKQRQLIASVFMGQRSHVSAEELYDRIKKEDASVGYSTVYRTLKLIVSVGLASERKFRTEEAVFEPELGSEHHDHLVCLECGRIVEFENRNIEELQREVARANDFRIERHMLVLFGYCSRCRRNRRA
jgi:Fur family ferric uptake transcriptional regulator